MDDITATLLGLIRSGEAASRAQLVRATGLARATVAHRLDLLLAAGLVRVDALVRDTGGRPADRLVLNESRGWLLGADVGGTHIRTAVMDLQGAILDVRDHELDVDEGPERVLGLVRNDFVELLEARSANPVDAFGIAIGLPGPVEQSTGRVVSPPTMRGWDGAAVPDFFAELFAAPVVVDKDANIMAIGEHSALAQPVDDVLLLKVGMGIGAGIIANGRILRGMQGAAGDLGHLPRKGGAPCRCGQEGCAEATAGGWAIVRELHAAGRRDAVSSADLVALAQARDPLVLELLRSAGHRLGDVLADAVGVLNPGLVIVAGNLAPASDDLIAGIRERVYESSHPLATKNLSVELGLLGPDAGLTGAAVLAGDAAFAGRPLRAIVESLDT